MNTNTQRGMVLLVSLILLLMLTLIAITASTQSTLQLRIASNSEQNALAFQAAEAGLARWTGAYLNNQTPLPLSGNLGDSVFTIAQTESRWDVSCPGASLAQGSGAPRMDCFDLIVKGGSVCNNNSIDTCAVITTHRQGGQRRGEIQ